MIALVTAIALALQIAPAAAEPRTSGKRQEAARIKSQVDSLDRRLEIATEDFNEADARYRALSAKARSREAELAQLRPRIARLQKSLESRADHMYRSGPTGVVEVLLGTRDFEDFATTWDLLGRMNEQEARMVADLKRSRERAQAAAEELAGARKQAKGQLDLMGSRKRAIQRELAQRKGLLRGVESDIAALEAAEEARQRAAVVSRGRAYGAVHGDFGSPKRGPRSGVVAIAMRYLGAPYRWGAAGPNAFDCSGFTMYVYRQVGVSLPHSSRAQYGSGERVSRANLKPGDLVFFGRGRIHHVGIYIGGGQMVHAPHTGDVVRIAPAFRSDYAGAVRP